MNEEEQRRQISRERPMFRTAETHIDKIEYSNQVGGWESSQKDNNNRGRRNNRG